MSGLTDFERDQVERMAAADPDRAPEVMVDMIVATLEGAARAGIGLATMVTVLDRVSAMLVDKAIAKGINPLAPITAPRKAV